MVRPPGKASSVQKNKQVRGQAPPLLTVPSCFTLTHRPPLACLLTPVFTSCLKNKQVGR